MSIFDTIFGQGVSAVKGIIEEFHMSPEDKAKLEQATAQLALTKEQMELAQEAAMAELQSKNITAETTSSDPWVRRARPTFLYVMIAAIGYSLILCPIINAMLHKGLVPMEIPSSYLELFGVGFLGYTGARTWEKVSGVNNK